MAKPAKLPKLAKTKPTYVDSGLKDGKGNAVKGCDVCGAVVYDEEAHDDRHARSATLTALPSVPTKLPGPPETDPRES